ncbi:MAG: GTP cyclohydrolase 1 [Lentisphaerae bacterium ADurb.BinA184]|nr:MAG: GTP cyclohydrolase 1 [Lentisphaerae bacterium ADurb.BinA184]
MQDLIRQLLVQLGEDPDREGLRDTPKRMASSLSFLTHGYQIDPADIIKDAIFAEECNHMVIVRNIELYSLCEHHMLPFFGSCHIGYIPNGRVFGVSKLARLVDCFARRLQLQERLTQQIAQVIRDAVQPEGVGVVIEAQHLCMMMRGVEKQHSKMVTSAMLGTFRKSAATRNEFLELIRGRD